MKVVVNSPVPTFDVAQIGERLLHARRIFSCTSLRMPFGDG